MQICGRSTRVAGFGFPSHRWLRQEMEWSGSTLHSPDKAPSLHAGTGSSCRRCRRFASINSAGHPPGSALAQRLCGSPMPLIQCDDCTRTVLRLTSGTPKHPGWVFFKCENDGVCVVFIRLWHRILWHPGLVFSCVKLNCKFRICGPAGAAPEQTRKRAYSANILLYGSVLWGLTLRPPAPARKAVYP